MLAPSILTTDRLESWLASLFVCTTTRKAQKLCVKPCHAFMARIGLSKTVHKSDHSETKQVSAWPDPNPTLCSGWQRSEWAGSDFACKTQYVLKGNKSEKLASTRTGNHTNSWHNILRTLQEAQVVDRSPDSIKALRSELKRIF